MTENRTFLKDALQAKPEEVAGYHGTSAEAVIAAAQTGFLPTRTPDNPDFYFFAATHPGARNHAREYAAGNARLQAAHRTLGFQSIDAAYQALDEGDPEIADLMTILADDDEAHGVVIALKPSIYGLPRHEAPEPGEVCVETGPDGLPIRYIAAIETYAAHERELLEEAGLLALDHNGS